MGSEAVRERLAREAILRERMAPRFRFRGGMADRRWPVRLLDSTIRFSGLAGRARRNFETIHCVEREWKIEGLSADHDGLRILQATDFHLDFDPGLIGRLRKVLGGVDYDLACLTGDFFDLIFEEESIESVWLDDLAALFRGPTYAVLGNHDILTVADHLERTGVRVLMNEGVLLGSEERGLWLAGVDDPRLYRSDRIGRALENRPGHQPVLLLAHAPQVYADAAAAGVDLMVCGHTHGGQVKLPGGLPVASRFKCPSRMVSGSWRYGRLQGYTSNGCGGCKLPYRFNAPAEVTLHVLRRA